MCIVVSTILPLNTTQYAFELDEYHDLDTYVDHLFNIFLQRWKVGS